MSVETVSTCLSGKEIRSYQQIRTRNGFRHGIWKLQVVLGNQGEQRQESWTWNSPVKKLVQGFLRNIGLKKILRSPNPLHPTNTDSQHIMNQNWIGFPQRPLIRVKLESHPEAVFVLAKHIDKVYENILLTVRSTKCFVVILDTEAGSSFIWLRAIPQRMRKEICPLEDQPNILNESGKSVPIVGVIYFMDQIGTSS